jgi:hypothetical protein
MTDIFISYASKDKNIADTICAKLEQQAIKCWIAPRDIKPGEEYASGIVRGIDNCKCMVIVFSSASNASKHVLREVERAVGVGAVVLPFRIEDIMPTDSMDYFLKVAHWLDAKDMNLDQAIAKLATTTAGILDQEVEVPSPSSSTQQASADTDTPAAKPSLTTSIAIVAAIALGGLWFSQQQPEIKPPIEEQVDKIEQDPSKTPSGLVGDRSGPLDHKKLLLAKLVSQNKGLLEGASKQNIESVLDISVQIPNKDVKVKTWIEPERSQFMEGDTLKFKASLSEDAYLAVYVHSMDGSTYLIYPNHLAPPKKIAKDTIFTVGNGDVFELEIAEPFGVDVVQFIATTEGEAFQRLLKKHAPLEGMNIATVDRGTIATEMSGIKKRGIKVKGIKVKPGAQTLPGSPSSQSFPGLMWGESVVLLNTRAKE